MNCGEDEKVCSVKKENNLGYYRLHTIWKDDGFLINIASKDGAWRGEMTPNDIKIMSSQLELDPKVYLRQCKTALTSHGGQQGITYAVDNGSFTWKKIVDEDSGIKIKLGSVILKPTSFVDTIQNLVTVALECNSKLQKKLEEVNKEKNSIEIKKNELSQKLDKLILLKNIMENDLYSKFILLLNSKKEKIVELSHQLSSQTKIRNDSEYDNPYNVETDVDTNDDNNDGIKKSITETQYQRPKKGSKCRRNSLSGECSKGSKKEPNIEIDTISNVSLSETFSNIKNTEDLIILEKNEQKKSDMPSSKDELLNFFFSA